jgi:abortive infection bacteriophage resistance protein
VIYPAFLLLRRLPNLETKQIMIGNLYDVFEKNIEYIDLNLIGFPENYKEVLKNNIK